MKSISYAAIAQKAATTEEPQMWRDRYGQAEAFHRQWTYHLFIGLVGLTIVGLGLALISGWARLGLLLPGFLTGLHLYMALHHLRLWLKSRFMVARLTERIVRDLADKQSPGVSTTGESWG